jgi:hypothetical protein
MEGLKEFPFRFGMREHPDLERARFSYDLWRMLFEHLRVTIHRREPVWWKELLKLWHQAGNVGCLDDKWLFYPYPESQADRGPQSALGSRT